VAIVAVPAIGMLHPARLALDLYKEVVTLSRAIIRHRMAAGLAGLFLLTLVSGCTSGAIPNTEEVKQSAPPHQSAQPTDQKPTSQETKPGSDVGNLAPSFKPTDVFSGQPVSHVPGKPTVLFFMAA
jgi:hypothetical protein